jgi:hypothetical protein
MEGSTCRLKRHSVGVADGCSMGRCSRPLSVLPNLPSPVSTMGSLRSNEGDSGSSSPRSQSPRGSGCYGSQWLWQTSMVFQSPYASKALPSRGEVGYLHAVPDGDPGCSAESDRRQRVRLRQTRHKTQHLGIELIAPHRSTRKNKTQDRRRLRRYRRRWKIERLFAWLQNFRRLVVRYERYAENFLGMLQLGCCLILLRHL